VNGGGSLVDALLWLRLSCLLGLGFLLRFSRLSLFRVFFVSLAINLSIDINILINMKIINNHHPHQQHTTFSLTTAFVNSFNINVLHQHRQSTLNVLHHQQEHGS